jgi:hypothetical protein
MLATMKSRFNAIVTFLYGDVNDKAFIPPKPVTLDDLKQCITTATAAVDEDRLTRVWKEFDYRVYLK